MKPNDDQTQLVSVDDDAPRPTAPVPACLVDREARAKDPEVQARKIDRDRAARADRVTERARESAERMQGADLPVEQYGDWSRGVPRGVTPVPLDAPPQPQPGPRGAGWNFNVVPETDDDRLRRIAREAAKRRGAPPPVERPGSISAADWNRIREAGRIKREGQQQRGDWEPGFGGMPSR